MWWYSVVYIILEKCTDAFRILSPFTIALEVENILSERRIEWSPVFGEDFYIQLPFHEVRVVIDVYVRCLFRVFETVEIDSMAIVLTDIVSDRHIVIWLFHDSAEPQIVMTVVVLDVGVYAVVIGIEPASIFSARANIAVRLIVLNLYTIGIEIEYAVSRTVSTAVRKSIPLINCVLADSRNDVVSSCFADVVIGNIDLRP